MMEMIRIESLTKRFGPRLAVENLTLAVRDGEIFGFVGPNGAGKTSTIRMLATLLAPDTGEIWIAGHSVRDDPRSVRQAIGYMPDFFGVYNDLRVWEYLDFFAACYDIPEDKRAPMIGDLLDLVDLAHRREDQLESLSRGMKQRLSLARTLIHDPKILILDEPASGLDPRARVEIRALLLELAEMGKTIFFSTHILADVAEVCTHIGIIEAGRLVAAGPLDLFGKSLAPQRLIRLRVLDDLDRAAALLAAIPEIQDIRINDTAQERRSHGTVQFWFSGDDRALSRVLATLVESEVGITYFAEDRQDLEDVFLSATEGLVT